MWQVRLPAWLAYEAMLFLIFAFAREVLDNRAAAWWAVIITLVTPLYFTLGLALALMVIAYFPYRFGRNNHQDPFKDTKAWRAPLPAAPPLRPSPHFTPDGMSCASSTPAIARTITPSLGHAPPPIEDGRCCSIPLYRCTNVRDTLAKRA